MKRMTGNFFTAGGIEIPALTTEQMREVDRVAMIETGPTLFQMMEKAGQSLSLLAEALLGEHWRKANILVLAGNGGNGGGGICGARYLTRGSGNVRVALSREEDFSEIVNFQLGMYRANHGRVKQFADAKNCIPDLVIDALIGYGARGVPTGRVAEMIDWINTLPSSVFSLDIPSGLNATTGLAAGVSVEPDVTMTLALPKTGLLRAKTGLLYLADIGIRANTYKKIQIDYEDPFEGLPCIELQPGTIASDPPPKATAAARDRL